MRLRPIVLLATLLTAGAALEACTNLLITKGAVEEIFNICSQVEVNPTLPPRTDSPSSFMP